MEIEKSKITWKIMLRVIESERVKEKFETSNQICGITKVMLHNKKLLLNGKSFLYKLPLCFNFTG
jgi:hypothetical protein